MSNLKTVAYLTSGHDLFEIFPDGWVPVLSFIPEHFDCSPEPFFLVNGSLLTDLQVNLLAKYVMHCWPAVLSYAVISMEVGQMISMCCWSLLRIF
jgi:hypothetical protein